MRLRPPRPRQCQRYCENGLSSPLIVLSIPHAGHVDVTLPDGFGASPITTAERETWLKLCRDTVPAMLRHTKPDAPGFVFHGRERDIDIYKYDAVCRARTAAHFIERYHVYAQCWQ